MDKKILIVVFALLAVLAVILISPSLYFKEEAKKESVGKKPLSENSINEMLFSPEKANIEQLKSIIENESLNDSLRERAIFVLTEVSIKNNESKKTREYLKSLLIENKLKGDLRSSAFANIYLIDEANPRKKYAGIEVFVEGGIRKNSKISVKIIISSEKDGKATLRVGNEAFDSRKKPELLSLSKTTWRGEIKKGETKEFSFDFLIQSNKSFETPVLYKISYDYVDYEKNLRIIYFDLENNSYKVRDER